MVNSYNLWKKRHKIKKGVRCIKCKSTKPLMFDMDSYIQNKLYHGEVCYCEKCASKGKQEFMIGAA